MDRQSWERQFERMAVLEDPVRRRLYRYVAAQPDSVSRDQAARAGRISRALAAFHLDKLVDAGLLDAAYRRLSGRRGPGAGRPAKLYRRSAAQLAVSVPERRYELVAQLLAQSVAEGESKQTVDALEQGARNFGRRLGDKARRRAGARPARDRLIREAEAVLDSHGFEPFEGPDGVRLRNCPFDAVAREHRALVCGMNLALMRGLAKGLKVRGLKVALDPQPGMCCVVFRAS